MTTVAVTNHAVERYRERVSGTEKLSDDAIRTLIRGVVESAFDQATVREHPGHPERRIVPFRAGKEQLYLALGPNETSYPGDWAVIGTLNDRESGKSTLGATLGDIMPESVKKAVAASDKERDTRPQYLVRIRAAGTNDKGELYEARDSAELRDLLTRRSPDPEYVEVFERKPLNIKRIYVIDEK